MEETGFNHCAHVQGIRTRLRDELLNAELFADLREAQVLAAAKKWTKSLNPQSPTPYGNGVTAMPGPEAPKVFYPVLWSFGGEVFDSQLNPHLTTPEATRAAVSA